MFKLFSILSEFVEKVPSSLKVIVGNSLYERTDRRTKRHSLKDNLWLLPKYNIIKSKILKEEIDLEIKILNL
jgi:hypothetical protein